MVDVPPDLVIDTALPTISIAFTQAYRQIGLSVPLIHSPTFFQRTTLLALGSAVEGEEGVSWARLVGPAGDKFRQAFKDGQTEYPDAGYMDASSFDAMTVAMLGVLKAAADNGVSPLDVTGPQVTAAMPSIDDQTAMEIDPGVDGFTKAIQAFDAGQNIDYTGGSGPVDWDANFNTRQPLVHVKLRADGSWDVLATYDCVSDDSCPVQ